MQNRGETLWLVNATHDFSALPALIEKAQAPGRTVHVLHRSEDREAIRDLIGLGPEWLRLIEPEELAIGENAELFFLPCSDRVDWAELAQRAPLGYAHCIQPLVAPPTRMHRVYNFTGSIRWWGWRARGELAARLLREPAAWEVNGVELIEAIQRWPDPPRWQSIPVRAAGAEQYPSTSPPVLTLSSSVLAVIPFFRCEEWLHACLTCMDQQTRPPENIVVIDDCSPALPLDFLEPFPNVTLLRTTRNAGPEKILNNIIRATEYDAYMLQDPDDWSAHDRLETSLRGAEQTGADMVGGHEFRIDLPNKRLELCIYPPDVNYAMSQKIGHHLLHCTSLISRGLAMRVGGFDERLKLVADTDFVVRAWHAGRIVNLPTFSFFRRVRPGSLTTRAETGYKSVARNMEVHFIAIRSQRHLEQARAGHAPNVFVERTEPLGFVHHRGPKLRLAKHEEACSIR